MMFGSCAGCMKHRALVYYGLIQVCGSCIVKLADLSEYLPKERKTVKWARA